VRLIQVKSRTKGQTKIRQKYRNIWAINRPTVRCDCRLVCRWTTTCCWGCQNTSRIRNSFFRSAGLAMSDWITFIPICWFHSASALAPVPVSDSLRCIRCVFFFTLYRTLFDYSFIHFYSFISATCQNAITFKYVTLLP